MAVIEAAGPAEIVANTEIQGDWVGRDRGRRREVTNDGQAHARPRIGWGWPPPPSEAATAAGRGGVGQLVAVAVAAAVVDSVAS